MYCSRGGWPVLSKVAGMALVKWSLAEGTVKVEGDAEVDTPGSLPLIKAAYFGFCIRAMHYGCGSSVVFRRTRWLRPYHCWS